MGRSHTVCPLSCKYRYRDDRNAHTGRRLKPWWLRGTLRMTGTGRIHSYKHTACFPGLNGDQECTPRQHAGVMVHMYWDVRIACGS